MCDQATFTQELKATIPGKGRSLRKILQAGMRRRYLISKMFRAPGLYPEGGKGRDDFYGFSENQRKVVWTKSGRETYRLTDIL